MSQVMDRLRRPGLLTFAAVVMFAVAGLRIISGLSYLFNSAKIANLSGGLFGSSVAWWGIWDLGIAALAFFAGWSLLNGNGFGRVIGYAWAVVAIIESFTILSYAPWFGFASIMLAVLVIFALATTSDYRDQT